MQCPKVLCGSLKKKNLNCRQLYEYILFSNKNPSNHQYSSTYHLDVRMALK